MTTIDLLFLIAASFWLLMIVLQLFTIRRAVHNLWTFGLPVILVI